MIDVMSLCEAEISLLVRTSELDDPVIGEIIIIEIKSILDKTVRMIVRKKTLTGRYVTFTVTVLNGLIAVACIVSS